jgi:hypothetical protein
MFYRTTTKKTKNLAKIFVFLTRNKAKLCKILIITLVFEKNANFSAENCQKSPKIVIITSTPQLHYFLLLLSNFFLRRFQAPSFPRLSRLSSCRRSFSTKPVSDGNSSFFQIYSRVPQILPQSKRLKWR